MWPCHSPLVLLCQLALYLSLCGCVLTLASLLLNQHTWKQSGDNSPVRKPVITHLLLTTEDSFQLIPDCCISSGSVAQACFGPTDSPCVQMLPACFHSVVQNLWRKRNLKKKQIWKLSTCSLCLHHMKERQSISQFLLYWLIWLAYLQ